MNPLPGYRFANWDKGYATFGAPDYASARTIPGLPARMVLGDLADEGLVPVEVSPPAILRRQIAPGRPTGLPGLRATELEFFLFRDTYEEAHEKGWRGLTPHSKRLRTNQRPTSCEEYVLRLIPPEMCVATSRRILKGRRAACQHESRHLLRRPRDGGPHLISKRVSRRSRAMRVGPPPSMPVDDGRTSGPVRHFHNKPVGHRVGRAR